MQHSILRKRLTSGLTELES